MATIRVSIDELSEFDANLRTIKNNIVELSHVMSRVVSKIVNEQVIEDIAVQNEINSLYEDIKNLEFELDNYIYDINLIKNEFKSIDDKLRNDSVELKNMIHDLLRKTRNSFIPATYSINSSTISEESEHVMKVYGVNEKINQTTELSKYTDK